METIYTGGEIVTRSEIFRGSVRVVDGIISDIDKSEYRGGGAIDLHGEMLLPGLIEIHTDNLEKNIQPRPGVIWPSILASTLAHDGQIINSGITTVLDAVAVGGLRKSDMRNKIVADSIDAIRRGIELKLFKADHFVHLRCEVGDPRMADMLEQQWDCPILKLVSLMDHTPGQRQWRDLDRWHQFHSNKDWSAEEAKSLLRNLEEQQTLYGEKHKAFAINFAKRLNLPLASHDDTTVEETLDAASHGVQISEFPTTLEAAQKADELGMATVMGAPNVLRGGSHSGNVSASELANHNLLHGLSSDYVPNSLLHGAFHLAESLEIDLADTVAMVSANIAEMVGFADRGEIEVGKRADLLHVGKVDSLPLVKRVWKGGSQVV